MGTKFRYDEPERPSEPERVELWYGAGYVWPPNWQDEYPEYREKQLKREDEIMQIPGSDERWENWMQFTQAQLVPKFTETGFDLVRTPDHIQARLLDAVRDALENIDNVPYEEGVEAIYGPYPPKFVDITEVAWEVIHGLTELHEQWAGGIKLKPTSAYGVETHVISSIVHIAHEYDSVEEQWPIQIEDHHSSMHSVNLQPGEMLFYESAKCLHGRMQAFKGKYYGSLFLHYQPVDNSIWNFDNELVIASVPPHWNENLVEDHGSRWAGQGLTIDSLAPIGIGPRIVRGEFIHDITSPHSHPTAPPHLHSSHVGSQTQGRHTEL